MMKLQSALSARHGLRGRPPWRGLRRGDERHLGNSCMCIHVVPKLPDLASARPSIASSGGLYVSYVACCCIRHRNMNTYFFGYLFMYMYVWYVAALVAKAQASSQGSCTDRKHAGFSITLVKRTLPLRMARRLRPAHRRLKLDEVYLYIVFMSAGRIHRPPHRQLGPQPGARSTGHLQRV